LIKLNFILLLLFSLPLLAGQYYADGEDLGDEQDYTEVDLPYVEIEHIKDLAAVSREARDSGKIIMLEMSASYCSYCRTLEEHIIKPMLRSGDYTQHVLIRKLEIDRHYSMKLPSGKTISPAQLARQMKVSVTPTLIFLDGEGREVSERILGVNSLDFYGAYVDDALQKGYQSIQNKL
jgi:thioredoxin-related protein